MTLHRITIVAAPDAHPNMVSTYTWSKGMDLAELDETVRALQAYLLLQRSSVGTALAAATPIEPHLAD